MLYNRTMREYQVNNLRRPWDRHEFGYRHELGNRHEFGYRHETLAPWTSHNWTDHNWTDHNWTDRNWTYAMPATDILELDDQYILQIALPGVCLDDVELKVEGYSLFVTAKRTPNMFEEKAALLQREMPVGHLVREFEFETEILHEQIEARMDRGILFVSVPKVEVAIRIPVSAGNIESHLPSMKTRVNKTEVRGQKEISIK